MARVAFKQCDMERILRAGRRTGVPVAVRIERKTGDIIVKPVDGIPAEDAPSEGGDALDAEMQKLLRDHGIG